MKIRDMYELERQIIELALEASSIFIPTFVCNIAIERIQCLVRIMMANRKRSMQHSESYLISFVGDDIEHTDLAPGRDDLPLMSVISETSFASGRLEVLGFPRV